MGYELPLQESFPCTSIRWKNAFCIILPIFLFTQIGRKITAFSWLAQMFIAEKCILPNSIWQNENNIVWKRGYPPDWCWIYGLTFAHVKWPCSHLQERQRPAEVGGADARTDSRGSVYLPDMAGGGHGRHRICQARTLSQCLARCIEIAVSTRLAARVGRRSVQKSIGAGGKL